MTLNFPLLNSDKTEVVAFGPECFNEKLSRYILTLDGISLASSTTAKSLWVIFDQDLSFDAHIKQVCRTAFVIVAKLGTSCLRVIKRMHVLLQDWTTVILSYWDYLHWLPVKFRIVFKILLLTYKTLNGAAHTFLIVKIFSQQSSLFWDCRFTCGS